MNPNKLQNAIVQPGNLHWQTSTYLDASGIERAAFTSGRNGEGSPDYTVAEYLAILNFERGERGREFVCLPPDEASALVREAEESSCITPWKEVTEERWDDMLNVLPPQKWETVDGVNIFRMSEYYTGNITSHFARRGKRFFERQCRTSEPYTKLAWQVLALIEADEISGEDLQAASEMFDRLVSV